MMRVREHKRGGFREFLTIHSINTNVTRVRVHSLLASETNKGYTVIYSHNHIATLSKGHLVEKCRFRVTVADN